MEESGLFEYLFVWVAAVTFCLWFPAYVIQTRGRGMPDWGLAFCVASLCIFIPLICVNCAREAIEAFWIGVYGRGLNTNNIEILAGSTHNMARLHQLYIAMALLILAISAVQSIFSGWLLYNRRNKETLLRAIRLMWCSALLLVVACEVLPFAMMGAQGTSIAWATALSVAIEFAALGAITLYLNRSKAAIETYRDYQTQPKVKKVRRK